MFDCLGKWPRVNPPKPHKALLFRLKVRLQRSDSEQHVWGLGVDQAEQGIPIPMIRLLWYGLSP